MVSMDQHFAGVDEAWLWIAPHPADPRDKTWRHVQARVGVGPADSFRPILELDSKPIYSTGGFSDRLLDVTGRRSRKAGAFRQRIYEQSQVVYGADCWIDDVRGSYEVNGQFTLGETTDHCTIATRGKPVAGPEPDTGEWLTGLGEDALALGATLLGKGDRFRRSGRGEARAQRKQQAEAQRLAAAEAHRMDDLVEEPVTAFDGWLTATQRRTVAGEVVAEAWHVRIDRSRPEPGPISLALAVACAALCHRRAVTRVPGSVLDELLGY